MGARLADCLAIEQQYLVRADDQVIGVAAGQGAGLVQGQAQGQLLRCFTGSRRFIHLGCGMLEGYAQAIEEGASVGGAGGENQIGHLAILGMENWTILASVAPMTSRHGVFIK